METKMRAEDKRIRDFFSGSFFEVPDYQRLYAWEDKNYKDFWNDIVTSVNNSLPHYLGTITLKREDNKYYVIDGQQRLTTFYLFALALYCNLSKRNLWRDEDEKNDFRTTFLKYSSELKLKLGNINKNFFEKLVNTVLNRNQLNECCKLAESNLINKPKESTNRKLLKCFEFFCNEFMRLQDGGVESIKNFLLSTNYKKCLFLVKFTVEDEKTSIRIFEVINDRGLPLTYIDKLKSHLIFMVEDLGLNQSLRDKINNKFGEFFKYFDLIKSNVRT